MRLRIEERVGGIINNMRSLMAVLQIKEPYGWS